MRKWWIMLMLLVTCFVSAGNVYVDSIGDWTLVESQSLLDDTEWLVGWEDGVSAIIYNVGSTKSWIGIQFPICGESSAVEVELIYRTDKMEIPVVIQQGVVLQNTCVILIDWAFGSLLSDLCLAEEIMFRVVSPERGTMDATFILVPVDTTAAFDWAKSHLE